MKHFFHKKKFLFVCVSALFLCALALCFFKIPCGSAPVETPPCFLDTISHLSGTEWVKSRQSKLNDVTIIIPSCDKYSPLWPSFFACLFRFFPSLKTYNAHVPILLASGIKTFPDKRLTCWTTKDPNEEWSATLLGICKRVKTRFVLLLHDDYFLSRPVNEAYLAHILQKMTQLPIAHIEVGNFHNSKLTEIYKPMPEARIKPFSYPYRVCSQPCLWNVRDLSALIKKGENPWSSELEATKRSVAYEQKTGRKFLYIAGNPPIAHLNAVNEGRIEVSVQRWLALQGLPPVCKKTFAMLYRNYTRNRLEPYNAAMLQAFGCVEGLPK